MCGNGLLFASKEEVLLILSLRLNSSIHCSFVVNFDLSETPPGEPALYLLSKPPAANCSGFINLLASLSEYSCSCCRLVGC